MSDDPHRQSRLQKHYLDIPARWTDDQPNFLRFSSSPTPSPTPGPATPSPTPAKLERIRRDLRSHRWGSRHIGIAGIFSDWQAGWATRRKISLRFGRTCQFLDFLVYFPAGEDEETPILAYADQRHIEFERHQAERPGQQQSLDRENVKPYITALLIPGSR